jgi:hypothetical protein
MPESPASVRELCIQILDCGELEAKLVSPLGADSRLLPDREPGPPLHFERPARAAGIAMRGRGGCRVRPSSRSARGWPACGGNTTS